LFTLLAGSLQGLVVAGIAMSTGASLIPTRPDEIPAPVEASGSALEQNADEGEMSRAVDTQASEQPPLPPMMVFGPMLALAALEYLFFGDLLRAALDGYFGG
jgi:hypothetical protein